MKKEQEQLHGDMGRIATDLKGAIRLINRNLEENQFAPIGSRFDEAALIKLIPNNDSFRTGINRALTLADVLTRITDEFIDNARATLEQEQIKSKAEGDTRIEIDKKTRKAERGDMWILWAQKTIRWVLGSILAVVLYSGAVYISSKCSFIHVPVREWIIKDNSEAKP